jgi:Delta3-Delta2-enoyl-CoA isomerase
LKETSSIWEHVFPQAVQYTPQAVVIMATQVATATGQDAQKLLTVDRHGDVFVITLQRGPENRLTSEFCRQIIQAFHDIERQIGPDAPGAVITRGSNAKFWCTGADLSERETNPFANSDGFYPMLHTILDFRFPTIALLTGHTFGGACPFALAHDYRIMNSERGFICMVSIRLVLLYPYVF